MCPFDLIIKKECPEDVHFVLRLITLLLKTGMLSNRSNADICVLVMKSNPRRGRIIFRVTAALLILVVLLVLRIVSGRDVVGVDLTWKLLKALLNKIGII